jgi:ABC-2 type transport system permease protein
MKQILYTEWLKLKNYKAFIILSIFFAIGVLATNYIVYTTYQNVVVKSKAGVLLGDFNPYSFDYVWQTVSYTSGYLILLPVLLIIIIITNEFSFRTVRQNIIDGWQREEFFHAKLLLVVLFAIASTVMVFLTGLIFGFQEAKPFSMTGFSHVGYFFLKSLSYMMFAMLLSCWIRKTGFAFGIFFIYSGIENILAELLDAAGMKIKTMYKVDLGGVGDYLPMNSSDGLLSFPANPLKEMNIENIPTQHIYVGLSFALAYLLLFFFLSKRNLLKKDL